MKPGSYTRRDEASPLPAPRTPPSLKWMLRMIQEKSMPLLQISTVGSFQLRGGWEMEVSNGFGSLSEK